MRTVGQTCLAVALVLSCGGSGLAQESRSSPLAKQLVAALESAKLDSIAAKEPATKDRYIAALYIPGFQLLTIAGAYAAPVLLDARLAKKEYRDIYLDLNGTSPAASRVFVEDLGANGLKAKREENQPFDSVETGGKRTTFDGDWKKQKLSEEEYMKTFAAADESYARLLMALLAQLK